MIQKKTIGELCQIIGGNPSPKENEFSKEGIPFVKMMDLGRYHLTNNLIKVENKISQNYLKFKSLKKIPKGSILLPRSGSVGLNHRAILGMDAFIVSHICALNIIDNQIVHNKYLYYYLSSINMVNITKQTTGLDAITFEDLGKINIPLPPLETQKKIAAILDKADELRQNDKKILEKYDQLAQSVFLEMFGDPVRNERNWNYLEIKSLGKIITGSTPPTSKINMFGGNIPFVTPGDLDCNEPYKRFVTTEGAENSRIVTEGALFVCCIGATIGKIRLAKETCAFNQQINAIQWNEKVNPYYGLNTFQFVRKEVVKRAISTTLPILKKSEFEKIKMAVPSTKLQLQFGEIVKQIDLQKKLTEQSLRKSEELFLSLLQMAFRGELV